MRSLRFVSVLPLLVPVAASAQSTFVSFSGSNGVVFVRTSTGFSGGGAVPSLTLGGQTYADVTLAITPLSVLGSAPIVGGAELSGGSLAFTQGTDTLLSASFVGARLLSNGAFNTALNASTLEGDALTFGGLATGDQSDNGLSFALTPVVGSPNRYGVSSFAAVGLVQVVPEPASCLPLGLGAVAVLRRRKRA